MLEQIIEFSSNNLMLVSAFVMLIVLIIFNESQSSGASASLSEAVQLINQEGALPLDIRDQNSFTQGHIAGSVNIPLANLDSRSGELNKYKDKKILVICNTGTSAGMAVAKLKKAGYEHALRVKGGIQQWKNDALPLVKGRK